VSEVASVWGSEGIRGVEVKLDAFLTSALYSVSGLHAPADLFLGKETTYQAKDEVIRPQIWSGLFRKENISYPCQSLAQVTTPTTLSRVLLNN